MEEIDVHGAFLSVLRETAIPWGVDVNTGSRVYGSAPKYVQTKVAHWCWSTVVLEVG